MPAVGAEGYTTAEDVEKLVRIEKQLKRRFGMGSQVSEHTIIQDFVRQVPETQFTFKNPTLLCFNSNDSLVIRNMPKRIYRE